MGVVTRRECDSWQLSERDSVAMLWIAQASTYTPVNCSIGSTHGAAESVQKGAKVGTLVRSTDHKINGLVSENHGYNHVQTEVRL